MTFDKLTREAIAQAIESGITARMETYDEVWLTAEQLSGRIPFFTAGWLKHHGNLLPRERMSTIDADGRMTEGKRYIYPLHKLNRMVAEGQFRQVSI